MNEGKTPTTPTSSAIIAGVQVQELLKILHADRGLPTLAGKGYVFNGLTHDSYVVEYQRKEDCMSHETFESVVEMPWVSKIFTLRELVQTVKSDLGEIAVVDFDRDIATVATCSCGATKELFIPVHKLRGEDIVCQQCGKTMSFKQFHTLDGGEEFLDKTVHSIGLPLLHIVSGRAGFNIRQYEFTGDLIEFNGVFE
jgi:adenylyltransferase/sulfurtransferase